MKMILGDCLEKLKELTDNSVDSVVTDPPYGLSFMGKKWDYDVPSEDVWKECLRVLKPGGYLLSFAGTRTQHRMAVRIEDAGFEIRDMIAWIYASGFPKSLNIGKAVDKFQGNEREVINTLPAGAGPLKTGHVSKGGGGGLSIGTERSPELEVTKGTSQWEGWGTALKPALEPITVARKPISEKTVAENVLTHGTGGLNIDGNRVSPSENDRESYGRDRELPHANTTNSLGKFNRVTPYQRPPQGRWPANLIHDGSEEVLECFPNTKSGALKPYKENHKNASSFQFSREKTFVQESNKGSAARFFYCAKASKKDRDEGLEGEAKQYSHDGREKPIENAYQRNNSVAKNSHPTVKPTALMRYLVKLVTPPGGTVLDPFMGSGSTGKACKLEGFDFIGIEREEEYVQIAKARIGKVSVQGKIA